MRRSILAAISLAITALQGAAHAAPARASPGPQAAAMTAPIPVPRDRAYPGTIRLVVDATDVEHRIVRVHETLDGVGAGSVLLYPEWLPGNHAPQGPIDRFSGLTITAGGAAVPWVRDPLDVYAFHIHAEPGTRSIDIDFDYLSPTSPAVGSVGMSPDLLFLDWNTVVLYPAGYFARRIPVQASLQLPAGWVFGCALERAAAGGARTAFEPTSLETLVDSPVIAGRYADRVDLDPGAATPVHLDVFADRPEFLAMKPEQLAAHRALVQQSYRLFGAPHFVHYDFLYSLSDQVDRRGLEHHQSSENGSEPAAFTEWDKMAYARSLLPHEFSHSWNGKFRRPADLWTANYNVPMQGSLLWVYEGQTEYWGEVLAARSGLWTRAQFLDQIALDAAYYSIETGHRWRPLEDTTNDPVINPRRPMSWRDQQRFEDYYVEGALIWLDADTLIRERSQNRRSLDDFARAFFGIDAGGATVVTYGFADVVRALDAVEPNDWAAFLRLRLDGAAAPPPLDGVRRGGYRLVFTDTPSEFQKSRDDQRKRLNLIFSIGLELDVKDGAIRQVIWDSPAFQAGLTEGGQILAVNGTAFGPDLLRDAIRESARTGSPIQLIVKTEDRFRTARLDYSGGLRYPHLERDPAAPARLDDIMAPRP
jgi:predicted metalloprotease with PDZ domain